MPKSASPFYVPKEKQEEILEDIHLRFEAQKRKTNRAFNPELGETAAEAEDKLQGMRDDINKYGEYVYGLPPARHHRYWNEAVDRIVNRKIPQNKILLLAPPNSAKSTWNSLIRTTHYLGNNNDHQILFMTSSDDMAKTFSSSVRITFEQSSRHREVFPQRGARPDKKRGWSGEGLYLQGLSLGRKIQTIRPLAIP